MTCAARNWLLLPLFFALLAACGSAEDRRVEPSAPVVHFANWDGEIGPNTHAEFERQTGIRVVAEELIDNATLQTKLLVGGSNIDVVVPGSNFVGPLIAAGALQPLDKSKLPNWRNLDKEILAAIARFDPGNRFAVPFVWGTQAFAYNVAAVDRALGERQAADSWRMLFDPAYAQALSACGIAWQDGGGSIMLDLGLLALGRDPATEDLADLAAAEQLFHRVRPFVRYVDSSGRFRADLATGEICIATGSSGELLQAAELARENGTGVELRYVLPEEGALLWVDLLVIPVDAPHVAAAHELIDFLLQPKVAADVTNASRFANANGLAQPFVDPALRDNPLVYPPAAVRARLHLVPAESAEYTRARTAAWTRIRTARPR